MLSSSFPVQNPLLQSQLFFFQSLLTFPRILRQSLPQRLLQSYPPPAQFPVDSFVLLSYTLFWEGCSSMRTVKLGMTVVCEAAPRKKPDSAAKRARQAEKRRIYNKARKSEIKTRMKKVLEELDELKKKTDAQFEEILPMEKIIGEAYSVIDKAVKVGTLRRNTGARRKSRLARRKKAVEIHHGWYTAAPVPSA